VKGKKKGHVRDFSLRYCDLGRQMRGGGEGDLKMTVFAIWGWCDPIVPERRMQEGNFLSLSGVTGSRSRPERYEKKWRKIVRQGGEV